MQQTAPRITDWSLVPLTFGLEYAALLIGRKRPAISRMCRMNAIPCRKARRQWWFDRESIKKFLENGGQQ